MKVSLKAARVNANFRQADVAQRLSISVDKIKYIEKHSENIDYTTLMQLCNLYNATMDDIFIPITPLKVK